MSAHPARLSWSLIAAVAGIALFASGARADVMDPISIGDSEIPGMFTGSVQVTNQTYNSALITVTLTNTSPLANGGYLTGLAFNDPNSPPKGNISGVTSFTPTYDPTSGQEFTLLGGNTNFVNGINTEPYGDFDIGAAVGGDWLGGGKPSDGLAVGETGTFQFLVTGTNLNNLSAATLLAAMSTDGTAGFAVRFRGFTDGSSDKDIAGVITTENPNNAVPAPPGVVLAGMGLGCLLLGRLRARRAAVAQV
jgi:hypothetical protein